MLTVRLAVRVIPLQLAAVLLCCVSGRAFSASQDTIADHVLGQTNFTSNSANQGGAISASSLSTPFHIAVDRNSGRIWVVDLGNNRVLSYPSAAEMANGSAADFVLGQLNFTTGTSNTGGISASTLFQPEGVAVDSAGNVYVCDEGNRRVLIYTQPLTTDAVADVVIGQANFTSTSPGTTAATFASPTRLALDQNGNLFVADFGNHRVLGYAPPFTTGMNATVVLGQPDFVSGSSNNSGLTATSLSFPEDVAFDSSNNLYVADVGNVRVLRYNSGFGNHAAANFVYGQGGSFVTNTSNKGGLSASSLSDVRGVSIDPFDNVTLTDAGNSRVVQYPAGVTTAANRVFGQPNFTTGTANTGGVSASSLNNPFASFSDNAGNLLIADDGNNRILEYDVPTAGAPTVTALFPAVMAAGSSDFTLRVGGTNFVSASVVQFNNVPRPTTFLDSKTLSAALPAADVASVGIAAISVSTPAPGGGLSTFLPFSIYKRIPNDTIADRVLSQPDFAKGAIGPLSAHSLAAPNCLTVDATGRLWCSDFGNHRVLSWANATALTDGKDADFVLGQSDFVSNAPGTTATTFKGPTGVQVDAAGNVYIADSGNNRVLIFNDPVHTDAVADVVLGQADFTSGTANGGGAVSAAGLNLPDSLALDSSGNLYVVESSNHRALRFAAPFVTHMNAVQVFGQLNFTSSTANAGGPSAATLNNPTRSAVDLQGNFYVTDFGNNRVLEYDTPVTTDSVADRVLGQPDFATITANTGGVSASSMNHPNGLALDPAGNLYISEAGNARILVFNSPLTSSSAANRVFGQGGSFVSNTANNGGISSASLNFPVGLAFDAQRNLYVSDNGNARILSYDHPIENPPVVSSAAQATPSTVLVGQTVNFSVAGTDPDNDTLTYSWNFGDGATGAGSAVSHAYSIGGVVTATVTIDDGFGGTVTSSVMVTVKTPDPLGDVKLGIKLNFAKTNSDMISASGTLELPAGALSGTATAQIADLIESFTLTSTSVTNADGKFSLSSKGAAARAAKFKLTLSKKTFAASLVSAGLVNMTVVTPVHVPITLTINGLVYQATVTLTYTGKLGVSGKTKQ